MEWKEIAKETFDRVICSLRVPFEVPDWLTEKRCQLVLLLGTTGERLVCAKKRLEDNPALVARRAGFMNLSDSALRRMDGAVMDFKLGRDISFVELENKVSGIIHDGEYPAYLLRKISLRDGSVCRSHDLQINHVIRMILATSQKEQDREFTAAMESLPPYPLKSGTFFPTSKEVGENYERSLRMMLK